jgi:hypothetical protein
MTATIELPDDPDVPALVADEDLLRLGASRFTQGYRA